MTKIEKENLKKERDFLLFKEKEMLRHTMQMIEENAILTKNLTVVLLEINKDANKNTELETYLKVIYVNLESQIELMKNLGEGYTSITGAQPLREE